MRLYFLITKSFLKPLTLLFLLQGVGLVLLWRKRQASRRLRLLLTLPFCALVAITLPAVVYPMLGTLEWRYPPLKGRPADAQAIVVLSGGIYGADGVRLAPELAPDTLYRTLHAADVYHRGTPCPVIVTGGTLNPASADPPVAPSMRELLVRLGVKPSDIYLEPRARTTFENAVESRKILQSLGLRKVVLVTEATHMKRSVGCFRKQGLEVVPAPCHHIATRFRFEVAWFLPKTDSLGQAVSVVHEWLGLAWYRLSGKI
jgi:uncharacterized SAM-binding protein YcdF (DUF218 family)